MKQPLNEGMITNFIQTLVSKFSSGKSIKDVSPELAKLAARDPELRSALKDLEKSAKNMRTFLKSYRKNNPEIADLADRLPKGF